MQATLQKEHQWLDQLIGKWTYESECIMGPERPPTKTTGTEVVRSLGGAWIVAEGEGKMPDGKTGKTIMTLGYNPQTHRYVGTFICSMMTHLWPYDGELEADERVLTLNSEGPGMSDEGKMVKYKDVIEFKSNDRRVMTSHILGNDGQWQQFMTAHYRRQQ